MRGRKHKPLEKKNLEGNPGKRDLPEPIKFNSDNVDCPDHLSDIAKEEWQRILPELQAQGLVTQVDRAALAGYCQAYGRWVEAEQVLKEKGPLYKSDKGTVTTSPMLWVANKALEQMHKLASEFGFTPASRTRITINQNNKKDDPFEELLSYSKESTKSK